MKDLKEWNKTRAKYWADVRRKSAHPEEFPNGFECPSCGGSLYDTQQMINQNPPILKVKCQNCPFKGERYE